MREYLRTASLVIPLILLPVTFITVLAQNAVPGDFLYGYKRGLEGVILASASVHPTTRAMFQSNLADRRFTEVEKVILAKQDTSGLSEFIFSVARAQEQVEQVSDEKTKADLEDKLIESINSYQHRLESIKTQIVYVPQVVTQERIITQQSGQSGQTQQTPQAQPPTPTQKPLSEVPFLAKEPPTLPPPTPTSGQVVVPTAKPTSALTPQIPSLSPGNVAKVAKDIDEGNEELEKKKKELEEKKKQREERHEQQKQLEDNKTEKGNKNNQKEKK